MTPKPKGTSYEAPQNVEKSLKAFVCPFGFPDAQKEHAYQDTDARGNSSLVPCFSPVVAYYSAKQNENGKRSLVFNSRASHSGIQLKLPCGSCIGCRLERSRQWAMRCLHENKLHEHSVFATLTYDNEHLPPGGTLVKRDFQLFMKRLRKEKGNGLRFFACGEYGDRNARPHYHALLYNCRFLDAKYHSSNGRGEPLYTSESLRALWPQGHNVLGAVTFESAAYVARYVTKKITGKAADAHYAVVDGLGEVYDRSPEFVLMSRRPGIGTGHFNKYHEQIYNHDQVVVRGRLCRPPRFYDNLLERTCAETYKTIRRKREVARRLLDKKDNTPQRMRVKELVALKRFKTLKRSV